jgi:hypothetical protein
VVASAPTRIGNPTQAQTDEQSGEHGSECCALASSALSASTAESAFRGKKLAASVLIAATVIPKAKPSQVVATSKSPYASERLPVTNWLK